LNLILYNYEKFTVYWSKDGGPMLIVRTVFQAGKDVKHHNPNPLLAIVSVWHLQTFLLTYSFFFYTLLLYSLYNMYLLLKHHTLLIVRTVFQAGYFCLVMFEGCKDMEYGSLLKEMFQANYFRIVVIEDETTDSGNMSFI
jgi:hypothetical protein